MKGIIWTKVIVFLLSLGGMTASAAAAEGSAVLPARKLVPWKLEEVEQISGIDGKAKRFRNWSRFSMENRPRFPISEECSMRN